MLVCVYIFFGINVYNKFTKSSETCGLGWTVWDNTRKVSHVWGGTKFAYGVE